MTQERTYEEQLAYSARKARRNRLQQARRAGPEAKAKEARASRLSYYRKRGNAYLAVLGAAKSDGLDCTCPRCLRIARAIEGVDRGD